MNTTKSRLNIPDRIRVGYQKRSDTYSGLLAYIVYYKNKNTVAKEGSWDGWRDHTIEPEDFDNVPIEGFVLNKHVGGHKSGWDFRQSYCRVWDPRGFEFEISIPNLLFILDHCTSEKGRGLSGEFVYAWEGKDLVLLPCCSPDYMESRNNIDRIEKIGARNIVVGSMYETQAGDKLIYVGKGNMVNEYYKYVYNSKSDNYRYTDKQYYIFSIVELATGQSSVKPGKLNVAFISDLKKLRCKVSDNEMTLVECEDIRELCISHMWSDSSMHKLGDLNFHFNQDKLTEWKEVMADENNIQKEYIGYFKFSDTEIRKFTFRKTAVNNFMVFGYNYYSFNKDGDNSFTETIIETRRGYSYYMHEISRTMIFDKNPYTNKELIDECEVYCVPKSNTEIYNVNVLEVSNDTGLSFVLGKYKNRINSQKINIKYI